MGSFLTDFGARVNQGKCFPHATQEQSENLQTETCQYGRKNELLLTARIQDSSGERDIWEFPKIRGTLFWGPYNKDPTI